MALILINSFAACYEGKQSTIPIGGNYMAYSSTLAACIEVLANFDEPTSNLPASANNRFLPYVLSSEQVGAVRLLLAKAKKLETENTQTKDALEQAQNLVDHSISYLGLEP